MTGEQQNVPTNVVLQPQDLTHTKYFRAINNKDGLRKDMGAMCKFVRETLFYALIHDARGAGTNPDDEVMKEEGTACKSFVKSFLQLVTEYQTVNYLEALLQNKNITCNICGRKDCKPRKQSIISGER